MARAALWDGLWIYCILASALLRIPPLKFPSLTPLLPLHSSLNPSSARFLPPAVHASSRPFLTRSLHNPSLPQPFLPPLTLSACLALSLPTSLPLLSPSLVPSIPHHPLAPSLLPPPPSPLPPLVPFLLPHPSLLPPSHLPSPPSDRTLIGPTSVVWSLALLEGYTVRRWPCMTLRQWHTRSNSWRCFSGALKQQPAALFQRGAVTFRERPHESVFDE